MHCAWHLVGLKMWKNGNLSIKLLTKNQYLPHIERVLGVKHFTS